MNRLFIIGNGFDLAHKLPTSYKDFINDFWTNLKENFINEEYLKFVTTNEKYNGYLEYDSINDLKTFQTALSNYCKEYGYKFYDEKISASHNFDNIFNFKNDFFRILNQSLTINNWVDVENIYYKILKESVTGQKSIKYYKGIKNLNSEFEDVKKMFENYLFKKVESIYDFNVWNTDKIEFYNILRPISLFNNENKLYEEFNFSEDIDEIKTLLDKEKKFPEENKLKAFCVNFNYTNTIYKYLEILKKGEIDIENIHIHGKLYDKENLINFGFGDEMDDEYRVIENLDDNEFLKNFKSFKYLQNSNYNEVLRFINSGKYQVIILGHSCGLSDRTLLNTIFEHKNCRSIKPFYYTFKDNDNKIVWDNYTELIQNISRHFEDKKIMREKIVNKTLCNPMPQIEMPKIKNAPQS